MNLSILRHASKRWLGYMVRTLICIPFCLIMCLAMIISSPVCLTEFLLKIYRNRHSILFD